MGLKPIEKAAEGEKPEVIKVTNVWFEVDGVCKQIQTNIYDLALMKSTM